MTRNVFVTGGTGFMGRALIQRLLERGHRVRALARASSAAAVPQGAQAVMGDALDATSFREAVRGCDTFVQLVGTAHPSPRKAKLFVAVDLQAALAGIEAATFAGVDHFVYLSVAQPAPIMKAYIEVRARAEAALRASGLNATAVRPWYVLGPGRRWPLMLVPIYKLMEMIPATRERALRLGLVTLEDMVETLVKTVEVPAHGYRVVEVKDIRDRKLPGTGRGTFTGKETGPLF